MLDAQVDVDVRIVKMSMARRKVRKHTLDFFSSTPNGILSIIYIDTNEVNHYLVGKEEINIFSSQINCC